jgi:large subunit ribosomal protein L25
MSTKESVLNVRERSQFGSSSSRRERRSGSIPVVVYSHGSKAKSFLLPRLEWDVLSRKGDIHLVKLKSDKGDAINALIKDVQHDYLSGTTLHVDFQEVRMDEVITATVPVFSRGIAIGAAQGGGVLEQLLHEIEVKCLPSDIPGSIEVDVSLLEIDQAIHIRDIKLPEKVVHAMPEDQTVIHVVRLRIEVEPVAGAEGVASEVPAGEATGTEPELVGGKGKEKEAEEEEGEKGEKKEKEKKK